MTETVAATPSAVETTVSDKVHPLEHKWKFWYTPPSKGDNWGLKEVATLSTVEEFWRLLNALKTPSQLPHGKIDYQLFKGNIKPAWEDPANTTGGKWSIKISHNIPNAGERVDHVWLNSLLAMIGEQFTNNDDIHGVVCGIRPREVRLSLWTRDAKNAEVQKSIGREWKKFMEFDGKADYIDHASSMQSGTSYGLQSSYEV